MSKLRKLNGKSYSKLLKNPIVLTDGIITENITAFTFVEKSHCRDRTANKRQKNLQKCCILEFSWLH